MKVLSLFDGIGTGRLSLERAGINVDKYYASEIDKNLDKLIYLIYIKIEILKRGYKWIMIY